MMDFMGSKKPEDSVLGWELLTKRELEVVALVAQGLTYPQMAGRLFIGVRTVESHVAHIFVKLTISSRHELTRQAMSRGIGV